MSKVNGNKTEAGVEVKSAVLAKPSNRPTMTRLRELFGDMIPSSVLDVLDTMSFDTPKEDVDKMLAATSRLFKDPRIPRGIEVAKGVYEIQTAKPFSEGFDEMAQSQIVSFWTSVFIAVFDDIDNREKEKNDGTE